MIRLYLLLLIGVSIYIFLHSRWAQSFKILWHQMKPSSRKKLTMLDVRHCILAAEKEIAIQIYMELFQVSYEEAVFAVNQLEKSIQEKNELE